MTPQEEREYLAEIERRWNRESWYRHPDGRLDWLGIEGLVLMAVMAGATIGMFLVFIREALP